MSVNQPSHTHTTLSQPRWPGCFKFRQVPEEMDKFSSIYGPAALAICFISCRPLLKGSAGKLLFDQLGNPIIFLRLIGGTVIAPGRAAANCPGMWQCNIAAGELPSQCLNCDEESHFVPFMGTLRLIPAVGQYF